MKQKIKYLILIILSTLLMGIGYASTTLTLDIKGTLIAQTPKEILITDIKCNNEITINNYNKTIIDSKITLSPTDNNSSITCQITIKNNTDNKYAFKEIVYGNDFYDNNDIIVKTNIEEKEVLNKNETKTFDLIFKYKDNIEITNNILNSIINIKFKKIHTITYENITNNNYPEIVFDEENLEITFIDDIPNNISVTGTNNYTYETPVLTLSNITNNITLTKLEQITNKHYDYLVFDGTKDSVINTDMYLYNEENINKNFRISFTIEDYDQSYNNNSNINQQTIFNCKNEAVESVWPGIMLRLAKGPKYEFGMRDSHLTTTYKSYNLEKGIKVSIIRENGKIYVNWNSRKHNLIYTYKDTIDTFDVPLTFGGIINASGEYDRIFKGILSNVTVNIYEESIIDEIDKLESSYTETKETNLYRLDGIINFDGTNYIDTGINLFSNENINKDFDISFTLEEVKSNDAQATLVNAKNEADTSYPGFSYRYESGKMKMTARWPGKENINQTDTSNIYPRTVNISRRDGIIYYKIGASEEKQLIETPQETLTNPFNVNLTFGASINSTGTPFRFFKGYVSDILVKLYD